MAAGPDAEMVGRAAPSDLSDDHVLVRVLRRDMRMHSVSRPSGEPNRVNNMSVASYRDVRLDTSQVDEIVERVTDILVKLEDKTGEWKYTCMSQGDLSRCLS